LGTVRGVEGLEREVGASMGKRIVALRRAIHREPEIGFGTEKTARKVVEAIEELPLEIETGVAENGIVATLRGSGEGPTVGLRADMDALPIREETGLPFASETEGKMHACGHDGHTSMLVGAAHALSAMRERFKGTVKFVFQPAEEGGLGGARVMAEEGAMDDLDSVYALHLWPMLPFGTVATKAGPIMAASDNFRLKISGRGGHAALPHLAVDAIVIAAQVVTALQTIVSREVDPAEPAVITLGKIEAGTAQNIVAETAEIRGTVRTLSPELRQTLPRRIEELASGIARGMRGEAFLEYSFAYPVTRNDPERAARVLENAESLFGRDRVIEPEHPSMGGEDFSFLLERFPGAYVWLGAGDEQYTYPLHNPKFGFDENILVKGATLLTAMALGEVA